MSKHKAGGSSRNGRDSNPKRRGIKAQQNQFVSGGSVIVRQVGSKLFNGDNVGMGRDYTLYAKNSGVVKYKKGYKGRTYVSIVDINA